MDLDLEERLPVDLATLATLEWLKVRYDCDSIHITNIAVAVHNWLCTANADGRKVRYLDAGGPLIPKEFLRDYRKVSTARAKMERPAQWVLVINPELADELAQKIRASGAADHSMFLTEATMFLMDVTLVVEQEGKSVVSLSKEGEHYEELDVVDFKKIRPAN